MVRAKCPAHIRRWIMEQVVEDLGGGSWNVEAWVDHLTSYTTSEWSLWMSQEEVWLGSEFRFYQPEEWEEWWASQAQASAAQPSPVQPGPG